MKAFVFLILLFSSVTATAQTQTEKWVTVPPGDLSELRQAMEDAYDGDPNLVTIIETWGNFVFTGEESGLPPVRTHLVIRGDIDGIRFEGAGENFANLVTVQNGGWLRLQNVELKDFSLDVEREDGHTYADRSLVINHGILEFAQVQLASMQAHSIWFPPVIVDYAPIIKNSATGQLQLDRVSLVNLGTGLNGGVIFNDGSVDMLDTQVYFHQILPGAPFMNNGSMTMMNISMFHPGSVGPYAVKTGVDADTSMRNSIVAGFNGEFCFFVTSLGHNLVDSDQCNFNAEGDIISNPVGLSWRPVEVDGVAWRHDNLPPLLTHALIPFASSPAVDSIDPGLCTTGNLLSYTGRSVDGNVDGVAKCDRGAVELQPVRLVNGGINGLYYDPDADGHYITIIDNPYNTLVMWNSFDKNGNPYFVNAIGQLEMGRSLVADAFTTVDGGTSPDGEILPAQSVHWGTLMIDMISCTEGNMSFHSDFPEFGDGQVRLKRLVYVKQLGCVD